jgi:hypothetical protein
VNIATFRQKMSIPRKAWFNFPRTIDVHTYIFRAKLANIFCQIMPKIANIFAKSCQKNSKKVQQMKTLTLRM